jgi:glucuronoarabinoxylan endo-1,4-beta-xylanase
MSRTSLAGSLVLAVCLAPSQFATAADVTVKLNSARQEIEGFGGSGAFRMAEQLRRLPPKEQQEALDLLFSTTRGAGISIIRNIIGDGGMNEKGTLIECEPNGPTGTIEPKEGQWNWTGDEDQIWLMKEAMKRGCTRFISAAWSPPAWMKTNNSVINGGNLKKDKYRAYAEYLAEYVLGYKKHHGIDIYAVSPQNEPTFAGYYNSCQWSPEDFLDLTKNHIKPVWAAKQVPAKYMLGEHMFWDESFAAPSLNDPAACDRVDIVAAHGYGNPNGFGVLPTAKARGKKVWETEVYNNADPSNDKEGKGTIDNALYWAEYIHNHMTVSEANAWLCWWLISRFKFEGTLISIATAPDPAIDEKAAVFKSEIITRDTPGQAVDIDVDISNGRKLFLSVVNADASAAGDVVDWIEPRLVGPKGELKLTDLKWTTASAGFNLTPKINKECTNGNDLIVNRVKYANGIGTQAMSMIGYDLPAGYKRFKCKAGLDAVGVASSPGDCTVRFFVYTDGGGGTISSQPYVVYPRLWILGNFSRFVRPGWVRVDATPQPAPGVLLSAYKNPSSDDFAIVAINKTDSPQSLSVALDGALAKSVTPYRTSDKETLQKLDDIKAVNDKLPLTLSPKSVTTFVGKAKR